MIGRLFSDVDLVLEEHIRIIRGHFMPLVVLSCKHTLYIHLLHPFHRVKASY